MNAIVDFSELIETHYLSIVRAALGYTGDMQQAQDMAHVAMLKAYKSRDSYKRELPFFPWIYRILRNTCLDDIKKRRIEIPFEDAGLTVKSVHPLDKISQEAAEQKLSKVMQTLSDEHREMINLRHFQDLSYKEIGEILSIPEGTVMSRLYRARVALNQHYREFE